MTTTRELLELAARAMWPDGRHKYYDQPGSARYHGMLVNLDGNTCAWNPLANAEQLVEMEARFEVEVAWFDDSVRCSYCDNIDFDCHESFRDHNKSHTAARAMASLRVVAEIQRAKEKQT